MLCTTINFMSGCDLTVFHNFESSTIPEKVETTKTPPSKTLSKNKTDSKIIDLAKPFLPKNGIILLGGGITSPATRLTLDFEAKTLTYVINKDKNSSPFDPSLPIEKFEFSNNDLKNIQDITEIIWGNSKSFTNKQPIADFNLVVILSKEGTFKVINSYGPPVEEVNELYQKVYNLLEEKKAF